MDAANQIRQRLADCSDLRSRDIQCASGTATLFYIDQICKHEDISRYIVQPLSNKQRVIDSVETAVAAIAIPDTGTVGTTDDAIRHILVGDAVVLLPFIQCALYCNVKDFRGRAIEQPVFDHSTRGPNESFNEMLVNNLNLIRRLLASPLLKIEHLTVGKVSNTPTALLYIKGTAPAELVDLVRERITHMSNDYVVGIEYIAEALRSDKSAIDTMGYTEKPETAVSRLFEGRVVVLVDGTPFALSAPYFFIENFQSPDDYHINRLEAGLMRLIRIIAMFVALLLPGLYIALTTHHYSLIPTTFLFKLAVSRAGVPLPTVVELVLMLFFFELAREAGKRLPQQLGQSLSVVAGLILGDAAVGVGLASQATVVVTGVYAICSFINPRLIAAMWVWTNIIILGAVTFGLHGFYIMFMVFLAHLSSLRTCGYPYMFPFGTVGIYNFKSTDIFTRGRLKNISRSLFKRKRGAQTAKMNKE